MPRSNQNPMRGLYRRLGDIGISRSFVQRVVLPSWWDDEAAATEAGYRQAVMHIARHVGLDLSSLANDNAAIFLGNNAPCKFKKAKNSTTVDVALARSLATQVSRFVASALSIDASPLPTASELRAAILGQGNPWVSLEVLAEFCWNIGIPVIHISNFPLRTKKPDGLTTIVDGRPVIVLSKDVKQHAWLLFILAHEIGHLASGHVAEGQVFVDEKVSYDDDDEEERAANLYALELLCGSSSTQFRAPSGIWPNAHQVARDCDRLGTIHKIDPGHVALNYAKGTKFFAVGNAALNIMNPSADAVGDLRRIMMNHLSNDRLSEDAANFVAKMTGTELT